ncbi:MAG: hypothetical protein VYD87_10945 [Pseudomonadota bacterium]|nr:hypothetical protein [Pseudomonadota bacterium]
MTRLAPSALPLPEAERAAVPSPGPGFQGLAWRPAVSYRNGVAWLSARAWRANARRDQLAAIKLAKARLDDGTISAAAQDIAAVLQAVLGPAPFVTCVPCGHSRRRDCFGFRLAEAVAATAGAEFVEAWRFRPVEGSSHPRRNATLPPLERADDLSALPRPLVVVDDIATSGFHIVEALNDARAQGVSALGAVWIKGTVA